MTQQNQQAEYHTKSEFTQSKVLPLFCKYAIPSAICLLFIGVQTVIDGLFVGNYIGPDALAGINITMPLYTFVSSLTVVTGIGCQTVRGISSGEGNIQQASDALRSGFIFLICISSLMAISIFCFSHNIVTFLGADEVLYDYSINYITTLSLFFPFLSLLFFGDYNLKSQGKPYKGLAILSGTILFNILFDYLFIVQLGLGVKGAALATGLAFSIGALISIPYMFKCRHEVSVGKGRFRPSLLKQMLYNGSSEGISELSAGIELFLFNRAMMFYIGSMGVAAFTSISYLLFVGITVFVGMSDGIIPVMSYNYGASNMKRVLQFFRINIKVNLLIGVGIYLLIVLSGERLIMMFFNHSEANGDVIKLAVSGSKICALAFLFNGINIAISSFFTSMGDARSSVLISIMRGFGLIAIGISILPHFIGITGIWLTIPIAELSTLLFGFFLFRKKITIQS